MLTCPPTSSRECLPERFVSPCSTIYKNVYRDFKPFEIGELIAVNCSCSLYLKGMCLCWETTGTTATILITGMLLSPNQTPFGFKLPLSGLIYL